jgi:hypothetical protein
MVRASFDIVPGTAASADLQNSLLLMEVSNNVFCYVIYNKTQQKFLAFRQYSLDFHPGKSNFEMLGDILQLDDLLQRNYREAYVVYNYAASSLLPEKLFHIELNKPAIELLYGSVHSGLMLSEKVYGWSIYNTYRVPRDVHALFQQKFAAGKYWHYYTLLLSGMAKEEMAETNEMHLIIAADRFTGAFFSNGDLQLVQTWNYQTPEDVSYQLLAMCNCMKVEPEALTLHLSGLIDEESNLYQELLKYFLQIRWEVVPDSVTLEEPFRQYPAHYFSPLLKMALCV